VFIYFQRDFRSKQDPTSVFRNLVYQLLMADINYSPDSSLLESYEELKKRSDPDFAEFFTTTCTTFSHLFGKVVVFFDALDECDPREHVTICDNIRQLQSHGIRTFLTTRFHEDSILRDRLPYDSTHVPISAQKGDVGNFVVYEIERQ
jgi:hypothetical protein